MFYCRFCTNTPFGAWFGWGNASDPQKSKDRTSHSGEESDATADVDPAHKDPVTFVPRTNEEIALLNRAWENYVHPRAREFWKTPEELHEVLYHISAGCHRTDDPVLGDDNQCVRWNGELSQVEKLPIIRMHKPGESQETQTYVNRALVFLYADEQSFQELQAKPKRAFTMACGNPWCVNLTHISLDD